MPGRKNSSPKDHAEPLDFRTLYYILREKAWVIAISLAAAGSITAAYLYRAPRIFAAKVVLQVEQEEQKVINIQTVQKEDLQSVEFLKTVEQTLQSRSLLGRVIETNNLAQAYHELRDYPTAESLYGQAIAGAEKMADRRWLAVLSHTESIFPRCGAMWRLSSTSFSRAQSPPTFQSSKQRDSSPW